MAISGVGTGNRILGNSIFGNTQLGIDLGGGDLAGDGVTLNDAGDGDTGPNNLQNFPVLTGVTSTGSETIITGTLNSLASTIFRIEFFASDAPDQQSHGEGQTFLAFANVLTDDSGDAGFTLTLPVALRADQRVSATATRLDDASNLVETSEFSEVRAAAPDNQPGPGVRPGSQSRSCARPILASAHYRQRPGFALRRRSIHSGSTTFSGVLISPTHVLTAAHTIDLINEQTTVTFANSSLTRTVVGSVRHPDFDPVNLERDVAIVTLDAPVDIAAARVVPSSPELGSPMLLAGFGPGRLHFGTMTSGSFLSRSCSSTPKSGRSDSWTATRVAPH